MPYCCCILRLTPCRSMAWCAPRSAHLASAVLRPPRHPLPPYLQQAGGVDQGARRGRSCCQQLGGAGCWRRAHAPCGQGTNPSAAPPAPPCPLLPSFPASLSTRASTHSLTHTRCPTCCCPSLHCVCALIIDVLGDRDTQHIHPRTGSVVIERPRLPPCAPAAAKRRLCRVLALP